MQSIKLNSFDIPDKRSIITRDHYYKLFLNDRAYFFKNKRNAYNFEVQLNSQLNYYYYQLNDIFISLFSHYRYMYISNGIDVMNNIKSINYWFYRLTFRTRNYNMFLFNYFKNVIGEMIDCFEVLVKRANYSRYYVDANCMRSIINQLYNLQERISVFPDMEDLQPKCIEKITYK